MSQSIEDRHQWKIAAMGAGLTPRANFANVVG